MRPVRIAGKGKATIFPAEATVRRMTVAPRATIC